MSDLSRFSTDRDFFLPLSKAIIRSRIVFSILRYHFVDHIAFFICQFFDHPVFEFLWKLTFSYVVRIITTWLFQNEYFGSLKMRIKLKWFSLVRALKKKLKNACIKLHPCRNTHKYNIGQFCSLSYSYKHVNTLRCCQSYPLSNLIIFSPLTRLIKLGMLNPNIILQFKKHHYYKLLPSIFNNFWTFTKK